MAGTKLKDCKHKTPMGRDAYVTDSVAGTLNGVMVRTMRCKECGDLKVEQIVNDPPRKHRMMTRNSILER